MDNMNEQFSDPLMHHLERGHGLQDITELTAGSMMSAERGEFGDRFSLTRTPTWACPSALEP